MEERKRSVAKMVSWRVLATVITFAVLELVTGNVGMSAGIAVAVNALKMGVYYLHERAWGRLNWGYKPKDAEGLSEAEEEDVKERLRGLGYL